MQYNIAVLGRTIGTANTLKEKLELEDVLILTEKDPPYKTYGTNNIKIFTDIEPERLDSRWSAECIQRNWEIIFIDNFEL